MEHMPKKKKEAEPEYSLEEALKSSKKTEGDLQDFLSALHKGKGFYQRPQKPEEPEVALQKDPQLLHEKKAVVSDAEEMEDPQLAYDSEASKKIAEEYINESISISEQKQAPGKKELIETGETEKEELTKEVEHVTEAEPEVKTEEKSDQQEESIYKNLVEFFEELFEGYADRYGRWEDSINALLSVLRKMRKVTKNNSKELVSGIQKSYGEIQTKLQQFKLKRDEMEKYSGVNIEEMSSEFKKLIGLMSIQLKEYRLRKLTDELFY
ncbi:MAG: hypothetical protein BAJALOKI1v1_390014 [Promethearchaeota archaeon]|nr:MAG: hypothetical protein BAJALOKI1v1_390014 [Candidatus Lokiarchaeota archaeon]